MLGVPGVILRFNSDRPEAIFKGTNILAPPVHSGTITRIVREVCDNKALNRAMRSAPKLYGNKVAQKMIRCVNETTKDETLFEFLEHHRLGFSKGHYWRKGFSRW
jgi:UDP-N-acetylglucosamine 2-epimerase